MIQSFFAQQITFPIQKEIQAFEQIKRTQDYSIRLETNQKDEFSKLAISINELLDYIEKEKNRDQEKKNIASSSRKRWTNYFRVFRY
ncbi:MAG: hypothetical protein ACLT97_07930 [Faecalibacillus intestinalis]